MYVWSHSEMPTRMLLPVESTQVETGNFGAGLNAISVAPRLGAPWGCGEEGNEVSITAFLACFFDAHFPFLAKSFAYSDSALHAPKKCLYLESTQALEARTVN